MIEKNRQETNGVGARKYLFHRASLAAAIVSTLISAAACSPLNHGSGGSGGSAGPIQHHALQWCCACPLSGGMRGGEIIDGQVHPVPPELPGTWHGGAGDSYYYTFDSHGQYRLEHARSGWREEGTFIVDGQSITFSPRGGYERTSAWEIQPLLVTLLFIDGFSYVKA